MDVFGYLFRDPCCGGGSDRIVTFTPVPFALAPMRTAEGEQAFLERFNRHVAWVFWTLGAIGALGSILVVLLVLPGVVNPTVSFPWGAATVGLLEIACTALMLTLAIRTQSTARRLVFLSPSLRLAIQIVRSSGRVDREWVQDIAQCRLTLHPVALAGPMGITFNGWMARVMVGDRCFTLACCKEKDEVIAYMHRLPAWLLAISAGEGEKVTGQLSDRRFSNKTERV